MSTEGTPTTPGGAPLPSRRDLGVATAVAAVVAVIILFFAVLPAEYGIDPTGVGEVLGLTKLSEDPADPALGTQGVNVTSLATFRVPWRTEALPMQTQQGYSAEGAVTTTTFEVAASDVSELRFVLDWDDANETGGVTTAPDTFEVRVTGPDATVYPAVIGRNRAAEPGQAVVLVPVRSVPAAVFVEGADAAAAWERARSAQAPDTRAQGTWTVEVECLDAGDGEHASGLPVGAAVTDDGNDWSLSLEGRTYALDQAAMEEVERRRETTSITLASGEGLEFKLRMVEGDEITFTWQEQAGLKVVFDFHGEPDDGSFDFESHRTGLAAEDQADFTAPFTGRHGWYFENRNRDPVLIQLTVSGVFETLGLA